MVLTLPGSLSQVGSPMGLILHPMLINVFINDLGDGVEGILTKCSGDSNQGSEVDTLEGRAFLDMDRLDE